MVQPSLCACQSLCTLPKEVFHVQEYDHQVVLTGEILFVLQSQNISDTRYVDFPQQSILKFSLDSKWVSSSSP